nr:unnamed protein product [Callosobruchus chinensis]
MTNSCRVLSRLELSEIYAPVSHKVSAVKWCRAQRRFCGIGATPLAQRIRVILPLLPLAPSRRISPRTGIFIRRGIGQSDASFMRKVSPGSYGMRDVWQFCGGKQKSSGAVVASLSLISNSKRLFSTTPHVGNMDCLHSLRYLSICWVVVGHRYIHNMVYPSYNSIQMIYWVQEYFSTLVMGGTVSVDTFFLISSIYEVNPSTDHSSGWTCNCFETFRIWTQCIVPVWSVADDMLFFYCSPILLVPLWKSPIYGKLNWLLLYIFSIFVSFWVAWTKEYDGSMPITPRLLDLEYFHKHYVAPHTRASPYILGLLFGYSLHKTRNHPVKISPAVAFVGWSFAIFSISSVVLIAHMFHMEDYVYNRMFSSLFLSCSRSVWTAGLIWMVFACINNCGGAVNFILTLPMFRVLGRLTYSISLLHFGFQAATMAAGKNPPHFSNFVVISMAISDIVIMTAVAVPFALFFEYPATGLVMGLLRKDAEEKKKPNRIDFKP